MDARSSTAEANQEYPQRLAKYPLLLQPKHKVFLCHSGAQKSFVEQLCVDLENAGYSPFFDRRPDSLPKGERFPELIFEAAKKCLVAVVVLSKEFFISKWPMLELVAFVKAKKSVNPNLKILPLFYNLRAKDFGDQQIRKDVISLAENLATLDGRINPREWKDSIDVLESTNGEDYTNFGGSEVAYRRAIVASICKMCKPNVQFDLSGMEGKDRMCNVLVKEFKKQTLHHVKDGQPSILGLHGMGGVGKTRLCMALCNHFHTEYIGKICYVEVQSDGYVLELQKMILKRLTFASEDLLDSITTIEEVLRTIIITPLFANGVLNERLPHVDVFLAIDNMQDKNPHILPTIKSLLKHMSTKSKAIVTSRSHKILKEVLSGGISSCIQCVPSLLKKEAMNIFLQHTTQGRDISSFTPIEVQILEGCVDRCLFFDDMVQKRYHPMALEVLGSSLSRIDLKKPLKWEKMSKFLNTFESFYKDPIFKVLEIGYKALPTQQHKLLFLDVAIFQPNFRDLSLLCSWLIGMHDLSKEELLGKLKFLKRSALIQEVKYFNGCKWYFVHDLYKELAEREMKGYDMGRWCVYAKGGNGLPMCLEGIPYPHWPNLVRLKLQTPHLFVLPKGKLHEWKNLQVLSLHCNGLEYLDIQPLIILRSLEICSSNLKCLMGTNNMRHLRHVVMRCPSLKNDLKFNDCHKLEGLDIQQISSAPDSNHNTLSWWLGYIPSRKLYLENSSYIQIINITCDDTLSRLCRDNLSRFEIVGLGSLSNLRALAMTNVPIKSLPGLEKLFCLRVLSLVNCVHHELILPDMSGSNLEFLMVQGCKIQGIPGLASMRRLRGFFCHSCEKFGALPDLRLSENLQVLCTTEHIWHKILAPRDCLVTTTPGFNQWIMLKVRLCIKELDFHHLRHLSTPKFVWKSDFYNMLLTSLYTI